jgi:hypothetical protein
MSLLNNRVTAKHTYVECVRLHEILDGLFPDRWYYAYSTCYLGDRLDHWSVDDIRKLWREQRVQLAGVDPRSINTHYYIIEDLAPADVVMLRLVCNVQAWKFAEDRHVFYADPNRPPDPGMD